MSKKLPFSASHIIAELAIQRLIEQGAFDKLPGAGKPIADLDEAYDENWWLKRFLQRENFPIFQKGKSEERA